ncbi:MAG: nucleotidyltransferase substrate binding protein [Spirochaetaceae bacterium]
MIDYSKFIKSLNNLELQYNNYRTLNPSLDILIQEAVQESVIQRFETCWDTLWKLLKKYLIHELGIPDVPNSPKPILRIAAENSLLDSSLEQWFSYASARISTSHDYNGEKALESIGLMEDFIKNAKLLYSKIIEYHE